MVCDACVARVQPQDDSRNILCSRCGDALGMESAREDIGITVSYWRDEQAARAWKDVAAHQLAQQRGRERWYADYRVRIATVHRDYTLAGSDFDR